MWTVDWDNGFVIGGDSNRRLTPSFRLREFRRPDGSVRVHRELVSALQLLRDRFGESLSVRETGTDGLSAIVAAQPTARLLVTAESLRERQIFASVRAEAENILVSIPNPDSLPAIDLAQALETAFSVTAAFETAGDMFQQITGNFDGAGLSFGPAQVNFGSGTLVPLFRKFKTASEAALRACFSDPADYDEWLEVMALPIPKQVAWANGITAGRGGHEVIEPWKGYFQAVGRVEEFRAITVESILADYGGKMMRAMKKLQTLKPAVPIDHLRCICALYDLAVQQGSLDKAWNAITTRVSREDPADQFALLRIALEERGRSASPPWRDDACSRRLGILKGVPETVGDRQRANINFYMLRDVRVRDADAATGGEIAVTFAQVGQVLGSGRTLLA